LILRDEPQYFNSYIVYDTVTNTFQQVRRTILHLLESLGASPRCLDCIDEFQAGNGDCVPSNELVSNNWLERTGRGCDHARIKIENPPPNWAEMQPNRPAKVAVLSAPTTATLVLTNRCDLACVHCNVSAASLNGPERIPATRWQAVLDELEQIRVFKVVLSGGEPFVYNEFDSLLPYFAGKKFRKSILTNGTHVTEVHVRLFKKYGITPTLSLDGGDATAHDSFRRSPGSFDALLRTLRLLRDHDVPFNIVSVVHKMSADQTRLLAEIAYENMAGTLFLVPLKAMGRGRAANRWKVDQGTYGAVQDRVAELGPDFPGLTISFDENLDEDEFGPTLDKAQFQRTSFGWTSCMAGKNGLVIDHDGQVYGCMPAMQMKIHPVGSVLERSVADIWRGDGWGVFREPVRQGCRATQLYNEVAKRPVGRRLLPVEPISIITN